MDGAAQLCSINIKKFGGNTTTISGNTSIYKSIKGFSPERVIFKSEFGYDPNSFEPIFTEEGLCYTTNSINSHEMYANT